MPWRVKCNPNGVPGTESNEATPVCILVCRPKVPPTASTLALVKPNPTCLTIHKRPLGDAINLAIRTVSATTRSATVTTPPLINPSSNPEREPNPQY